MKTTKKRKKTNEAREKKETQRAEDIETGFYALDRALSLNRLRGSMEVHRRPRLDEFTALTHAAMDRAAELLLNAFDGSINKKRYWPPKKGKRP